MAKLRNIFKKHLIPNLETKCRLCLSDKAIVQCIFQSEDSKEATDTLVEKIFECTAIMLHKDFDFPSPICEDCAFKLDEFLLFRTKCLRSNEIYRFNRLHKQRFLLGRNRAQTTGDRKPPVDDSGGDEPGDSGCITANPAEEQPPDPPCPQYGSALVAHVPLLTIAEVSGSSSSDSHTVIDTELCPDARPSGLDLTATLEDGEPGADMEGNWQPASASDVAECNGDHVAPAEQVEGDDELMVAWKPPEPDDSEGTSRLSPAPVVLLVDETDTTISEGEDIEELVLPLSELPNPGVPIGDGLSASFDDIPFPVETVEQLETLERLVSTSTAARDTYITVLRQLKTSNTSLSETYQQLFADRLLIHYNYDGISPKYNKRPLKTLLLFTECMAAAWEDHMDAGRVKDAVIEAVRKSHNRYNQYNHRKRASYEWL